VPWPSGRPVSNPGAGGKEPAPVPQAGYHPPRSVSGCGRCGPHSPIPPREDEGRSGPVEDPAKRGCETPDQCSGVPFYRQNLVQVRFASAGGAGKTLFGSVRKRTASQRSWSSRAGELADALSPSLRNGCGRAALPAGGLRGAPQTVWHRRPGWQGRDDVPRLLGDDGPPAIHPAPSSHAHLIRSTSLPNDCARHRRGRGRSPPYWQLACRAAEH
jgi:hypothetical protein